MSHHYSYVNSASEILTTYKGDEPFATFLRKYFAAHKKFGSTDRKQVTHLCYSYFRLGKALPGMPVKERIEASLTPENVPTEEIFPFADHFSKSIDKEAFIRSHFTQPDLFLRIRPGYEGVVTQKLNDASLVFKMINPHCIALPNSSKIDSVIKLNKEAVVQDYNSQQTGTLLPPAKTVWDACAGSGGKSIMAYDLLPGIGLTASDKRESIIVNLKKRFREAGIKKYKSFIADLSSERPVPLSTPFDLVITDVPCTGSGTWGRTPEQLYYFDEIKIELYVLRQKRIINAVIPYIKPGGHLLYITCSVFKEENENAVAYIQEKYGLELVKMELFKGYNKKADTLFAALLIR